MPAEQPSLKELFLAALGVAPAERAAWLEQACGPDAELRRRMDLMLAAHDAPQSLLDRGSPVADAPEAAAGALAGAEAERPGTVIGPYKLLEQIGEGGFGVVYMAEQMEPVRRKVALKILKPGMDTKQVVARFDAERQALAIMDHPNIAKVFDAGMTGEVATRQAAVASQERAASLPTADCLLPTGGRPYFVMELVKGVAITDFCDQNHLTPRQRLELFVPVC